MGYNCLWMEGFEHYSLNQTPSSAFDITKLLDGLWIEATGGGIVSDNPRTGAYSLQMSALGRLRRSLGSDQARVALQFGFYVSEMPTLNNQSFVFGHLRDSGNNGLIGLQLTTTGRIQIMMGGLDKNFGTNHTTKLAESTLEIAPGSWNHFEVKYFIDNAAGFVKVRVNGRDFVSVTGVDTQGAFGLGAQVAWGWYDGTAFYEFPSGVVMKWDDIAAGTWDDVDDATFLGQRGVYYLKPNADTATAQWSLTTGVSSFALVNEVAPDDDTNFLFSVAAGDKTAIEVEPLPANIVIVTAVMPIARARKTDTGDCDLALAVISTGTEDIADDHPLVTAWDWYYDVWMTDPNTSSDWNPLFMPTIEIERTL